VTWAYKIAIAVAVVAGSVLNGIALTTDAHAAGPTVGMVSKVENQAQVDGQAVAVGSPVHMGDTVTTGPKGRLQVTFRDQTNLSLGENATVVIDRYVFDPDASVGEATLNVTKGAFRLATGRLSAMTNKHIVVSTPYAAAAVRGTDFWGGSIEGQYGVLLVHASRLEVRDPDCTEGSEADRRRCRCAVTLDRAGEGTDIDRRDRCPGAPYQWPQAKIDAALSMTEFSLAFAPSNAIPAAVGLGAAAGGFGVSTSNNNNGPPPPKPPKPASP
jgi:FecR protein